MLDVHSELSQGSLIRLLREDLHSSGDIMANVVPRVHRTIQCLQKGDVQCSKDTFAKVLDVLDSFMEVVNRAGKQAGEKGMVLDVFQSKIKAYLHQLEHMQQDGDVGAFVDVLQYELIPLLAGWDGVKNELMDYKDALA